MAVWLCWRTGVTGTDISTAAQGVKPGEESNDLGARGSRQRARSLSPFLLPLPRPVPARGKKPSQEPRTLRARTKPRSAPPPAHQTAAAEFHRPGASFLPSSNPTPFKLALKNGNLEATNHLGGVWLWGLVRLMPPKTRSLTSASEGDLDPF
jgi:hypothetical protein